MILRNQPLLVDRFRVRHLEVGMDIPDSRECRQLRLGGLGVGLALDQHRVRQPEPLSDGDPCHASKRLQEGLLGLFGGEFGVFRGGRTPGGRVVETEEQLRAAVV